MVIKCDLNCEDQKITAMISLLSVIKPESVNAEGLFQTLERALQILGVPSFECTHM